MEQLPKEDGAVVNHPFGMAIWGTLMLTRVEYQHAENLDGLLQQRIAALADKLIAKAGEIWGPR